MRLTYVIRKINVWFARVVYERDKWDVRLDHATRSADYRVKIILHVACGCVWLSRRILWTLMNIGHAISCFMMRQMEYDADSYEAKLAGSRTFEATATRLSLLNLATQFALEDVRRTWFNQHLADSLPLLIRDKAGSVPPELREELANKRAVGKTGWFDTHPCDADRIRAARQLDEPGIFNLTEPATTLFADFQELSRTVTRHQYEKHFGLQFSDRNLVAVEQVLQESAALAETEEMITKFYGKVAASLGELVVESSWPRITDTVVATDDWRAARKRCEELQNQAEQASIRWREQRIRLLDAISAHHLAKAGFRVNPTEFGLPQCDHSCKPGECSQLTCR